MLFEGKGSRVLKFSCIVMAAAIFTVPALSAAWAEGPVGGATTPGDPSLLVTYSNPASAAVASPAEPQERNLQDSETKKAENPRKDG